MRLVIKALLRHFVLSALVIARRAPLYPRGATFPTSIFDRVCDMKVRLVGGSPRDAAVSPVSRLESLAPAPGKS